MEYRLIYRGNYNIDKRDFTDKWDLTINARTVFALNDIIIKTVSAYKNYVTMQLTQIPARIDLIDADAWLQDAQTVKRHPEPNPTWSGGTASILWLPGEIEATHDGEIGELHFGG